MVIEGLYVTHVTQIYPFCSGEFGGNNLKTSKDNMRQP